MSIFKARTASHMRVLLLALAVGFSAPTVVYAKESTKINVRENKEITVSQGDVMLHVTLKESLPNAFGGADIFGRKRDRGFVEFRFMGVTPDGKAVIRRRTVNVYSNETTMSRSGMRMGSANVQPSGNGAVITTTSFGAQPATVQPLPPDTIEIVLDLSKPRILTVEDRQIEVRSVSEDGVTFLVSTRK